MKVEIKKDGEVIWVRDSASLEGMASLGYLKDGTQQKIIAVLEDALYQAKAQLLLPNDVD
ncbi:MULTISPECIES: Rrf2 family transcriptional regulator [Enterobacter]|uniref:Rrf2 family transcriptional regulator n=1 Tax=Enterobacter TaxID=547 RepID=UPI0009B1BF1C|nr:MULTISPECIES: Rrf2 family transcriptional regulator [Enterobacter]OQD50677.1 Rrf2 family transcriptional regulator [Enterobacter cancerogenus]HAS1056844.1 Rrf2 family transcriptional regulator [Enterobacter cloacae]ELN9581163.1 Rrf2 family transcriptional regulator [Enterobacter roggenkampii]MCO6655609.1 Rrf2 family transcriptional regulator [Enterobacter roggenkampii]QMR77451.1 Rrf2 family transcriptional regulator [Enterobacter sp. RHBSTW-00175]